MSEQKISSPLLECIQLIRAGKCVVAAFDRHLDQHSITVTQWEALNYLSSTKSIRQIDFATKMDINRGSAMRSLRRLEEEGFIKQLPNESDDRSLVVEVTALGKRRMEQASTVLENFAKEVAGAISRTELKTLSTILNQMVENTKVEDL
jgi:DNA-binding MarR family transcriptional regulator